MDKITATFEVVTPMFLGGAENADDKKTAELRAASIKGQLRFWWRALHYSRAVYLSGGNEQKALVALREREQRLFGSSDKKNGQSSFIIKLADSVAPLNKLMVGSILADSSGRSHRTVQRGDERVQEYLYPGVGYLGYGLLKPFGKNAGSLDRPCITARQFFSITLIFKPSVSTADQGEIVDTIKLFGLIGGLGARTRRGFGSLALVDLKKVVDDGGNEFKEIWKRPLTKDKYKEELKALIQPATIQSGNNLSVTCFAVESRIDVTNWEESDSIHALDYIGRGMQRYRGWGHNGKVNGKPSEEIFEDDHDWYKRIGKFAKGRGAFVPRRTAFGLPHKYTDDLIVSGPDDIDRRGSPIFIHVHRTSDKKYFGVAVLIPTKFLPKTQVSISGKSQPYTFDVSVLEDFLNKRGTAGRTGTERFFDGTTILS